MKTMIKPWLTIRTPKHPTHPTQTCTSYTKPYNEKCLEAFFIHSYIYTQKCRVCKVWGSVSSRRRIKMKEKDLVKKISDYLKTENDLFFWKEHGGQFGTAGIPDIIVCYKGRFLAFECKVGKNKPTVLQEVTIRQILRAGGYAMVVRSVDEVKEVIQAFKKE